MGKINNILIILICISILLVGSVNAITWTRAGSSGAVIVNVTSHRNLTDIYDMDNSGHSMQVTNWNVTGNLTVSSSGVTVQYDPAGETTVFALPFPLNYVGWFINGLTGMFYFRDAFGDLIWSMDINNYIMDFRGNMNSSSVTTGNLNATGDLYTYNILVNSSLLYNMTDGTIYNSDEVWINKNITNAFNFNSSKLSTIYYNATQSQVVVGIIDGGTLADTQHPNGKYDERTMNFSETATTPGLDMRINFTGIDSFNQGVMRYKTSSLKGEYPIIQMWNYDTSIWEDYPVVGESLTFATITQPVFDSSDHVDINGIAQMRIYKSTKGTATNHYYIDWIAILKGYGTPSGEEIDPYSWHRNSSDESGNYMTAGNVTAQTGNFTNIFASFINLVSSIFSPVGNFTEINTTRLNVFGNANITENITSKYISTGNNEYLAHDIIRHTITTDDVAAGSFTTAWSKATKAKVADLHSVSYDISFSSTVSSDAAGGMEVGTSYDGSTITINYITGTLSWEEGDIVTTNVIYEL